MKRRIDGMVMVITGASAGIGRALAEAAAGRGAKLVLAARREEKLDSLNESLGGGHLVVQADVSISDECRHLIDRSFDHFGRVDTLVCNAGYGLVRGVAEMTADEVRDIFRTNVFGTTDCIAAATPRMKRQAERDGFRGQVVIVSSAAARRGLPFFGAYSATKAAQLSLAEALRVELKPAKIAVTSVHPVGTETDFFDTAEERSGKKINLPGRSPFQQTAAQVAAAMLKAVEKPRPEVWPFRIARYGLSFSTLFPGATDRAMRKARDQIEAQNSGS